MGIEHRDLTAIDLEEYGRVYSSGEDEECSDDSDDGSEDTLDGNENNIRTCENVYKTDPVFSGHYDYKVNVSII